MLSKSFSFGFILILLFSHTAHCSTEISTVRAWKSPEKTRIVFGLNKKPKFNVFQLNNPYRIVIDLNNTKLAKNVLKDLGNYKLIKQSRSSIKKNKTLRIVLELNKKAKIKSFHLSPGHGYNHRLVVDLFTNYDNNLPSSTHKPSTSKKKSRPSNSIANRSSKKVKTVKYLNQRDIIVAIDAGHGGDDPGAIGKRRTKEKWVVLSIAKKLAKKVNSQKGMRAVMIRTGDYYVSLRGRTRIARKADADVFISIHADAFRNRKAKGSSVFILSQRGSTSETARWLANRENSADLAGGVSLDDKDDLLAKVLLDLSSTASIEASNSVAKTVLRGLKQIGKTHKKTVERAGFVVLKSPDMPSILVETGFISNPYEEAQLRKSSYQQKIANAIFKGINDYFKRYPIPGTIYGQHIILKKKVSPQQKTINSTNKSSYKQKSQSKIKNRTHKIVRGDSLSMLAKRYRISIGELKRTNKMRDNTLILGKKLLIPN